MIPLLAIIIFMMNFFSSLEVRGGAQRAEGMSERDMSKMTIKVHAQGSTQGTDAAD